jgi:hypothetical protein
MPENAKRPGHSTTERPGRCGSGDWPAAYSPRTRLTMSLAMFGGTSMYSANCMV